MTEFSNTRLLVIVIWETKVSINLLNENTTSQLDGLYSVWPKQDIVTVVSFTPYLFSFSLSHSWVILRRYL